MAKDDLDPGTLDMFSDADPPPRKPEGKQMPATPKKKKKNGRWAKNRGDAYEREIAAFINEHVFDGAEHCRRAIRIRQARHSRPISLRSRTSKN